MYSVLEKLLDSNTINGFQIRKMKLRNPDIPTSDLRLTITADISLIYSQFSNRLLIHTYVRANVYNSSIYVDYNFSCNGVKITVDRVETNPKRETFCVRYDCTEEELFQLSTVHDIYGLTLDDIKMLDLIRSHYIGEL